jgi:DNA-binding transcriptional MerR regulator
MSMSVLKRDPDLESQPYRSISEVADLIGVKAHVLRYWETQFGGLRPRKNRAGNRMYRPEEIRTLMHIKDLLYARRFTIEGAKKKLLEKRREEPQTEIGFGEAVGKLVLHEVKTELRRIATQLRRGAAAGS